LAGHEFSRARICVWSRAALDLWQTARRHAALVDPGDLFPVPVSDPIHAWAAGGAKPRAGLQSSERPSHSRTPTGLERILRGSHALCGSHCGIHGARTVSGESGLRFLPDPRWVGAVSAAVESV